MMKENNYKKLQSLLTDIHTLESQYLNAVLHNQYSGDIEEMLDSTKEQLIIEVGEILKDEDEMPKSVLDKLIAEPLS